MNNKIGSRFNLSVKESPDTKSADVLLYGYIGEDWWSDPAAQNTDENVAMTIANLSDKYERLNIRINSPGGDIYHGNAIVTAIKNSKADIHTYNDGLAASMAAVIFCAGSTRHMATNALTMFHSPMTVTWGNAKALRSEADALDKFQSTLVATIAEATGSTNQAIIDLYMDHEDHWLDYNDCVAAGLITVDQDYTVEDKKVVESLRALNYINRAAAGRRENVVTNYINKFQNNEEMAAEQDTIVTPEAVAVAPVVDTVEHSDNTDALTAMQEQMTAMQARMDELSTENKKLAGSQNKQTTIAAQHTVTDDNGNDDAKRLKAYNDSVEREMDRNPAFRFTDI